MGLHDPAMPGTLGPDLARAAVVLRSSNPQASALEVLDACFRQRTGRISDFGQAVEPGEPFALLISEAFDGGVTAEQWAWVQDPTADPALVAALLKYWRTVVLPRFATRYGLSL